MIGLEKIPFNIEFPLSLLSSKKVDFNNLKERKKIFKRNIYFYKYEKRINPFLEERGELFFKLAERVMAFLKEKNQNIKILNISVFGSALYSKRPRDFDFLVITQGNLFSYVETKLNIKSKRYIIGISIKGVENLSEGLFDIQSGFSPNIQGQIIYRTSISLFRRHIPLIGYDFLNNRHLFLKNASAQVSDLLNNAYELYYLKNKELKLNELKRSKKILSRLYEASSYLSLIKDIQKIRKLRKRISLKINRKMRLSESKRLFIKLLNLYNLEINKNRNNDERRINVLEILQDNKIKENILERLENYWKITHLPHYWISKILDIFSKFFYDEDRAIKKIRERFPQITNPNSKIYSKKLKEFRKIKVKNLAMRIKKDLFGKIIADIGGRSDDFAEEILLLNKNIKKIYVTDLCCFTKRSKNKKIEFVVQSSKTNLPFSKNSIDTIILSMVLHHLERKDQNKLIKKIICSLKKNGRIILIEDSYPKKSNLQEFDMITRNFLKFTSTNKRKILYFYDWFGNRLMRNRDKISLVYTYKTMENWRRLFVKNGMQEIRSEFIQINKSKPDIFPPKAIIVFKKQQILNS